MPRTKEIGNPLVQVRGSSILVYDEPVRTFNCAKSFKRIAAMTKNREKQYSGGMSQGARKRLAKAVTIMSQAIKPGWVTNPCTGRMQYHKFSFITLTVSDPKNITAREGYDTLLNHFLDWLTRTKGCKTYIWKAELQKRGQLHYHITSPALIHWREIRDKWNDLQRRAGYLDEYAAENGHFNPNSTDIHDTRNVKNADRYLLKELSKSVAAVDLEAQYEVHELVKSGQLDPADADAKFEEIKRNKLTTIGKIWGCSSDLAGVGYFNLPLTVDHEMLIDIWVKEGKARLVTEDFFSMVYCDGVDPPDLLSVFEKRAMDRYLNTVMNRDAPPEFVPAECVQMDMVDVTEDYTFQQLQLFLN